MKMSSETLPCQLHAANMNLPDRRQHAFKHFHSVKGLIKTSSYFQNFAFGCQFDSQQGSVQKSEPITGNAILAWDTELSKQYHWINGYEPVLNCLPYKPQV